MGTLIVPIESDSFLNFIQCPAKKMSPTKAKIMIITTKAQMLRNASINVSIFPSCLWD